MGRIPDRWLDYSKYGQPIKDVPIVSFKTPLSENFHRPNQKARGLFVEKDEEFTPFQLVELLHKDGYELSIVIDLTFTFRYYQGADELENKQGIPYEKIKCEGQKIPDETIIQKVAELFNNVILENENNSTKSLVGIHCTHGLNRTGYLVCRYLIEWLNYQPQTAIEAFNKARGHDMERQNYLEDLMTRNPSTKYEEWKQRIDKNDNFTKRKQEVQSKHEDWLQSENKSKNNDINVPTKRFNRDIPQYSNDNHMRYENDNSMTHRNYYNNNNKHRNRHNKNFYQRNVSHQSTYNDRSRSPHDCDDRNRHRDFDDRNRRHDLDDRNFHRNFDNRDRRCDFNYKNRRTYERDHRNRHYYQVDDDRNHGDYSGDNRSNNEAFYSHDKNYTSFAAAE